MGFIDIAPRSAELEDATAVVLALAEHVTITEEEVEEDNCIHLSCEYDHSTIQRLQDAKAKELASEYRCEISAYAYEWLEDGTFCTYTYDFPVEASV